MDEQLANDRAGEVKFVGWKSRDIWWGIGFNLFQSRYSSGTKFRAPTRAKCNQIHRWSGRESSGWGFMLGINEA